MGRPLKQGLDYFPLDVDFLQDIKVRKIAKAQGLRSIPVLICLLSNIYRTDGYYLRWDGDMPYLIADECGAEEGVVTEVLSKAQQVGFFDAEILETYRVLTSRGVQKRYFLAVKNTKRKEIAVVENFLLIDPSDVPKNAVWYHAITMSKNGDFALKIVNSGGNSINSGSNPQRKGKRKGKRKEREKRKPAKTPFRPPLSDYGIIQLPCRCVSKGDAPAPSRFRQEETGGACGGLWGGSRGKSHRENRGQGQEQPWLYGGNPEKMDGKRLRRGCAALCEKQPTVFHRKGRTGDTGQNGGR